MSTRRLTSGRFLLALLRTAVISLAVVVPCGLVADCASAGALGRQPAGGGRQSLGAPAARSPAPLRARWLLTRSALAHLRADPEVASLLRSSRLYEILRPGQSPVPGFSAVLVAAFPSAPALTAAVTSGRLPPGTRAVLYDPETWALTPGPEQRAVVRAARQAAAVAHARGLEFMVAPALDLTAVLRPTGAGPRWRRFLASNLAASLAVTADVIDLQAQSLERDARTYGSFVASAAAQARAANPAVTVLAGLSTNPPGPPVTIGRLTAAVAVSRGVLDGYWLNIPSPGPRCPACGPASPQVGIGLLRVVLAG